MALPKEYKNLCRIARITTGIKLAREDMVLKILLASPPLQDFVFLFLQGSVTVPAPLAATANENLLLSADD